MNPIALLALGAGALFLMARSQKITSRRGVRTFSESVSEEILASLRGTSFVPVRLSTGRMAVRIIPPDGQTETTRLISAQRGQGGAVYISDSVLDLGADKGPTDVDVLLVLAENSHGASIAGPNTHFAQLV